MTVQELIARLRSRTVPNWVHTTGFGSRMDGHKPDPDCQMAADQLEVAEHQLANKSDQVLKLLVEIEAFGAALLKAEAELERLRAEAERYRYLRDRSPNEVLTLIGTHAGCWIDCESNSGTLTLLTGEDADASIDAAIAAGDRT
jgi:hypothetical protein